MIVESSKTARHGDIVIAALNTECVCKRLHNRDVQVVLMAENPKFPPRYVMEGDELVVWGGGQLQRARSRALDMSMTRVFALRSSSTSHVRT